MLGVFAFYIYFVKNSLICEKLSIRLSTKFSLRIFCWNDKREPFAAHQNAHLPPVLSLILKVSDVWRFYVGYCTCVLTSGCNILFLQPSVGSWESKEIPVTTAFPVVGVVLHSVCSGYETGQRDHKSQSHLRAAKCEQFGSQHHGGKCWHVCFLTSVISF